MLYIVAFLKNCSLETTLRIALKANYKQVFQFSHSTGKHFVLHCDHTYMLQIGWTEIRLKFLDVFL